MQTFQDVVFAPQSQKQVKQLLKFLDTNEAYASYRKRTEASRAYKTAVKALKQFHKHVYNNAGDYEVAGKCLWETSGLTARCEALATEMQIPAWTVTSDANAWG